MTNGLAAVFVAAPLIAPTGAFAHDLPLGDGKVTSHPAVGHVYSCQMRFRGQGALHDGPWIEGDTWDPDAKPQVSGRVMWAEAYFRLNRTGDELTVESNGLPVGQPTGAFPIARNDPAYRYDTNPNRIRALRLAFSVPAVPVRAAAPSCLPMGMIGFTLTGVAIYNALDAAGRDAAAHEIQDLCDGHPQGQGQYHYHSASRCLSGATRNEVVGFALDGYPILGMRDAGGRQIANRDLDACHGRAETVTVGGRTYSYAYRLTEEYPYTLGCFTGEVGNRSATIRQSMGGPLPRGPGGRPLPPPPGR